MVLADDISARSRHISRYIVQANAIALSVGSMYVQNIIVSNNSVRVITNHVSTLSDLMSETVSSDLANISSIGGSPSMLLSIAMNENSPYALQLNLPQHIKKRAERYLNIISRRTVFYILRSTNYFISEIFSFLYLLWPICFMH